MCAVSITRTRECKLAITVFAFENLKIAQSACFVFDSFDGALATSASATSQFEQAGSQQLLTRQLNSCRTRKHTAMAAGEFAAN